MLYILSGMPSLERRITASLAADGFASAEAFARFNRRVKAVMRCTGESYAAVIARLA